MVTELLKSKEKLEITSAPFFTLVMRDCIHVRKKKSQQFIIILFLPALCLSDRCLLADGAELVLTPFTRCLCMLRRGQEVIWKIEHLTKVDNVSQELKFKPESEGVKETCDDRRTY